MTISTDSYTAAAGQARQATEKSVDTFKNVTPDAMGRGRAVAAFIEAGRKVNSNAGTRSATRRTVTPSDGSDLGAIRGWAHENGIPVAARGRIAASVKEQYLAATAG